MSVQGGSFEQQQIVKEFQQMRSECNEISQKIAELEVDRNEHKLVVDALKNLGAERRCYRMIGGVLAERTVGEVFPAVQKNLENIEGVLKNLHEQLSAKEKAMNDFKVEHKIKVMGEDADETDIMREQAEAQKNAQPGSGPGILA